MKKRRKKSLNSKTVAFLEKLDKDELDFVKGVVDVYSRTQADHQ